MVEGGITVYPDSGGHDPIGIVEGSDGALWYTNAGPSPSIGRITAAGKITHYTDPRLVRPFGIAAGPDGNVWFCDEITNLLSRVTPQGVITRFDIGTWSDGVTAGVDGNLWVATPGAILKVSTAGMRNTARTSDYPPKNLKTSNLKLETPTLALRPLPFS